MRQIDKYAAPEIRVQAHALLGRCLDATGDRKRAGEQYDLVIGFYDTAEEVAAFERTLYAGDTGLRQLAKVLSAVGEAMVYRAEQHRREIEAMKFPEYRGSGETDDVQRFVAEKIKPWLKTKLRLIREASSEYGKVLQLKPSPPPQWVVRAGSAVGKLWSRFVAEFRSAPYPKAWDLPGPSPYGGDPARGIPPLTWHEIRAAYLAALDEVSRPYLKSAELAYRDCLRYGVRFQFFDEHTRSCEEWLSRQVPDEFHLIDEFRSSPTRVNSGLDEQHQQLTVGGAPVRPR